MGDKISVDVKLLKLSLLWHDLYYKALAVAAREGFWKERSLEEHKFIYGLQLHMKRLWQYSWNFSIERLEGELYVVPYVLIQTNRWI